ncbi:FeoA family protein, partial [Desulfobacula sp.]
MKGVISRDCSRKSLCRESQAKLVSMMKKPCACMGNFSLRTAMEGDWVRIISVNSGKRAHDRLNGFGLRVGAEVQVLHNSMNGKLLISHGGARLYLGAGMAHKI